MRMVKDLELNKGGMNWDLEIWGFDQIISNSFLSFLFLDPHDTSLSFNFNRQSYRQGPANSVHIRDYFVFDHEP